MPTVRDRIDEAVRLLADVSDSPRADAEFLMAHLLGVSRARLAMRLDENADVPEFRVFVERRLAYEPIPYILGEWEFFSVPIKTRAPVLVPRPETEHLVEVVLDWVGRASLRAGKGTHTEAHGHPTNAASRILELCTGTGCVAIALAENLPQSTIVATDIGEEAFALAEENVSLHCLKSRITIRKGDLFHALYPDDGPFDVICANPPYVEVGAFSGLSSTIRLYEDPRALVAGTDGLDTIRRIIAEAPKHLVPGGLLALEIGEGHYDVVALLLTDAGFREVSACNDLAGIRRIAYGCK